MAVSCCSPAIPGPEPELTLLLEKLKLELLAQPPPKITAASAPPL
jgi:hypothetical protein